MGYYILGIIIFLLAIVFVSDLIRNRDNKNDYVENERRNTDIYTRQYIDSMYGNSHLTEMSEDLQGQVLEESDIEPDYYNAEHQALKTVIDYSDNDLEDVSPQDSDEDEEIR